MSNPYASTINDLVAGSFGGAAQVLVGQPLDTIKTRAQIAPSALVLFLTCSASWFIVIPVAATQKGCL